MTARLRLMIVLARPTLLLLVGLFAATGLAEAGRGSNGRLLAEVLAVVVGCLLFAVAVNDLADERVDRVNLAGDRARPLVSGAATRIDMAVLAAVSAIVAVGASVLLGRPATVTAIGGLAFTAAYSLRPVRIADRGVIAPMLLPLGYVTVPYLLGIFAVRSAVSRTDLLLLVGLYAGFIGRILLKDFRDVRGDALFGKRTFLVRHGRSATCGLSALFLTAGVSALPFVRDLSIAFAVSYVVLLAVTLGLLARLAVSRSARRDSTLIAAIAMLGRGMVVVLYGHLAMVGMRWSAAVTLAVTAITLRAAYEVVTTGAMSDWAAPAEVLDRASSTL